ncbi:MAG: hypothetical protein RIF41_01400 [Polyangiaceae bacterium]
MRTPWPIGALACLLTLVVGGCKKDEPPGHRFACTCDFLTDMDDASVQKVEVCAANESVARERAIGCAQSGAPATIQGCRCEPSTDPGCPPEDCEVRERR